MRRTLKLAAPLAAAALALPALAGGADCADKAAKTATHAASTSKCTASKEECSQYFATAKKHGWLGVEYDKSEAGVIAVKKVVPGSPADQAGFQAGDVLVALNGVTIGDEASKEKLMAVKKNLVPGSNATYTIKRGGSSKDLTATLGTMPDAVYQAMYEEHMKEHVAVATR